MSFHLLKGVTIDFPKSVLQDIFDECDRYDDDETGGRILGTYGAAERSLQLDIKAHIDSGPRARRSAVSFFQDGAYQEQIFRDIEAAYPEIEHLGNWHTHHMNGLQHLSSGDLDTYHRIVNHPSHNTDFFYALLVTTKHKTKDPMGRYSVKHYLFRRADPQAYEIPARAVKFTNGSQINMRPQSPRAAVLPTLQATSAPAAPALLADKQVVEEFFPEVHPFQSPKLGLYWKGLVPLANGLKVQVVILHDEALKSQFSALLRDAPDSLAILNSDLEKMLFPSARAALLAIERACNQFLFNQHKNVASH